MKLPPKILLLLLTALLSVALRAQNNTYSIDDECYTYFQQAENNVANFSDGAFDEAMENLLATARRKQDTKAETIYYVVKLRRITNQGRLAPEQDRELWNRKVNDARREAQHIARTTGYMQYYYYAYELCQTYYYNTKQSSTAMNMLMGMMREARDNDDQYGLWTSLQYISKLYIRQSDDANAKPYLLEAVHIKETTSDATILRQNNARLYCTLAQTYPPGSDSCRINVAKAVGEIHTRGDSIQVSYYQAQLAAWDGDKAAFDRCRSIIGTANMDSYVTGGGALLDCVQSLLEKAPMDTVKKQIDRLQAHHQTNYVAQLTKKLELWELATYAAQAHIDRLTMDHNLRRQRRLLIRFLFIALPFYACLFSLLVHIKLAARTNTYKAICMLTVALAGFLFTGCCYDDPHAPLSLVVIAGLSSMITAPSLVPLMIMYYRRARRIGREQHPAGQLWVLIPSLLFTAALVTYIIAGGKNVEAMYLVVHSQGLKVIPTIGDNALRLYFFITEILFRVVLTIEAIWFAVYVIQMAVKEQFSLGNVWRYYFKGGSAKTVGMITLFALPAYLLIITKLLTEQSFLNSHPVIDFAFPILLTFFIVGFSFFDFFTAKRSITRSETLNVMRYNYSQRTKAQVVEQMLDSLLDDAEEDALRRLQERLSEDLHIDEFRSDAAFAERPAVAEKVFTAMSDSWSENQLLTHFQELMRDQMLFLQPKLTLDDVADKLGTNKFYVSKLVNNAYNLGFPELINILRVDYAEQYILNHRDAKQEEIARECGFLSASSFNTTFKKVTGMTPKVWIASQKHNA